MNSLDSKLQEINQMIENHIKEKNKLREKENNLSRNKDKLYDEKVDITRLRDYLIGNNKKIINFKNKILKIKILNVLVSLIANASLFGFTVLFSLFWLIIIKSLAVLSFVISTLLIPSVFLLISFLIIELKVRPKILINKMKYEYRHDVNKRYLKKDVCQLENVEKRINACEKEMERIDIERLEIESQLTIINSKINELNLLISEITNYKNNLNEVVDKTISQIYDNNMSENLKDKISHFLVKKIN